MRETGFKTAIKDPITYFLGRAILNALDKTDMTIDGRITLNVRMFAFTRAKLLDKKEYQEEIRKTQEDLEILRKKYEPVFDSEPWTMENVAQFNVSLDNLEYRLIEIITKAKIIDAAGIQEMVVPD